MDESHDVATLVAGLTADSESARKYAVFKLKGLLGEPSFASAFIHAQGLPALRQAVLDTSGNTQAYALGSLVALLELDTGWDCCDDEVLETALSLAISHPLVNIVRNALALLVLVVARPLNSGEVDEPSNYGFRALKPALDNHPAFLESLVHRLSASDHTLCANALQLVNALMRDAVVNGGEDEWPKYIKRLQDLGVIGGVGMLMRGNAASDADSPLAQAILEFQGLTKLLLRKWRDVSVNVELHEHKRALKTINLLSKPEPYHPPQMANGTKSRRHHPEKWRRLGFETESPAWEFEDTGYLGMMDLIDFCRRNEDSYVKTLMEQSSTPRIQRCPIARASLGVTLILYEHFEIDDVSPSEWSGRRSDYARGLATRDVDQLYRPLLLQWGRLHSAAVHTFLRLWKDAGAEHDDFYKMEELVRIVVERVVGSAGRKTDIAKVEEELRITTLAVARKWQMENLDDVYQDAWGPHLVQVREGLHSESLQFMKEQRVRCLLQGAWFPLRDSARSSTQGWRFVRLSHNRRWLHYQDFDDKDEAEVALAKLAEKLDLNQVTSVDSNISAAEQPVTEVLGEAGDPLADSPLDLARSATMKISILGSTATSDASMNADEERVLLDLSPQTPHLASEWLDGLLMLLNQEPITKDTTRWMEMMEDWGVRLRLLNLRWEDVDWEALESTVKGDTTDVRPVPGREDLSDDYYYALPDGADA